MSIPEVESAVGKIGRVDSPLDPAPISMIETVITYKSEYVTDKDGHRLKFRFDDDAGDFARDGAGNLIEDPSGRPFRQWRDHIRTPDDIWQEITEAAEIPGTTSAPKLQPIAARMEKQAHAEAARLESQRSETNDDAVESEHQFKIQLDRAGRIRVDGQQFDRDELIHALQTAKEDGRREIRVTIQAPEDCPIDQVVSVASACLDSGAREIQIAIDEEASD